MKITNRVYLMLFILPLVATLTLTITGCEKAADQSTEVSEEAALPGDLVSEEGGDTALAISPSSLAPGVYKVAYSETITGTGGSGDYSVVLEGTLPVGFAFSDGTISGTTEEIGTFPIDIELTDADTDESVQKGFDLVIEKETPVLSAFVRLAGYEVWQPAGEGLIEKPRNARLKFEVQGNAEGYYTWSLIDAPAEVCLTVYTWHLDDYAYCNTMDSIDVSDLVYVFSLLPWTTDATFKIRVQSPFSNPVERDIKFTLLGP